MKDYRKPLLAQRREIDRRPPVGWMILAFMGIPIGLLIMGLVMPYRSEISQWGESVDNWFAQMDNLRNTALFCFAILSLTAGKLTYDKIKRL